ncbi:MAG: 30S ribosomal protein S6 [Pseudomonadaceae bacterium]|nr:30S ribosomal protein S6 [Pseudomonadaceae bacterium]
MAFYELTYVLRPDVPTQHVDATTNKVTDAIKKAKGKVVKTEQWGLRTLAYPIKKHKKGYYTMLGLSMPGEGLAEVENMLKLSEDIIRFMTVKVEDLGKEPSAIMKAKAREAAAEDFAA